MASLRDTIQQNLQLGQPAPTQLVKQSGQLFRTPATAAPGTGTAPPTPTSQLAGQAGLTAPPTTPAGVGMLGGTPQQQAMAGAPNQKASAIRQATDSQNTIQQAVADKRYQASMTSEEQQKAQKGQDLAKTLGGTQQKVQDLVQTEVDRLKGISATPTVNTAGVLQAANPANQAKLDQAAADFAAGKDTQNNLLTMTQLGPAGSTGTTIQAAMDAAAATQAASTGAAGAAAAGVVGNPTETVGKLLPSLGTTSHDLGQLLGLDPTQVEGMTLDQLSKAVDAVAASGASAGATQAASVNPLAGQAERAAAIESGKNLATSGVASADAQLQDLGKQLQSADTVTVGGQQYTTSELLSNSNISKMVSDYLTLDPNSQQAKQFASDPTTSALAQFANKYRGALTTAAQQMDAAAKTFGETQTANKGISTFAGGQGVIPDSIMALAQGSDWNTASATKMQPKGVVASIQSMPPDWQTQNAPAVSSLLTAAKDPDAQSQLAKLTPDQLKAMFTVDQYGKTPADTLKDTWNKQAELTGMDPHTAAGLDSIVAQYFGGPIDTQLADDQKAKQLGLNQNGYLAAVDKNRDGKIDATEADAMRKTLLDKTTTSVDSALKGTKSPTLQPGYSPSTSTLTKDQSEVYSVIGDKLAAGETPAKAIPEVLTASAIPVSQWLNKSGAGPQGERVYSDAEKPNIADLQAMLKLPAVSGEGVLKKKVSDALADAQWRKYQTTQLPADKPSQDLIQTVYANHPELNPHANDAANAAAAAAAGAVVKQGPNNTFYNTVNGKTQFVANPADAWKQGLTQIGGNWYNPKTNQFVSDPNKKKGPYGI